MMQNLEDFFLMVFDFVITGPFRVKLLTQIARVITIFVGLLLITNLLLAGNNKWDSFDYHGSWELLKHGADPRGKVSV